MCMHCYTTRHELVIHNTVRMLAAHRSQHDSTFSTRAQHDHAIRLHYVRFTGYQARLTMGLPACAYSFYSKAHAVMRSLHTARTHHTTAPTRRASHAGASTPPVSQSQRTFSRAGPPEWSNRDQPPSSYIVPRPAAPRRGGARACWVSSLASEASLRLRGEGARAAHPATRSAATQPPCCRHSRRQRS